MYCKSCGKEISDNSAFCQHCGAPVREEKVYKEEGTITFHREMSRAWKNGFADILINERVCCRLRVNDTFTISIPFGSYTIGILLGTNSPDYFTVTVSPMNPNPDLSFKINSFSDKAVLTSYSTGVIADEARPTRRINILGIIASSTILLATFLPFISVNAFGNKASKTMFESGDGVFFLILAGIGILLSLLGRNLGVVLAGSLSVILFYLEASNLKDIQAEAMNDIWTGLVMSMIQKDLGYYLLLVGSMFLIVAGVIGIIRDNKAKQ